MGIGGMGFMRVESENRRKNEEADALGRLGGGDRTSSVKNTYDHGLAAVVVDGA
jgi:hypothetical protein